MTLADMDPDQARMLVHRAKLYRTATAPGTVTTPGTARRGRDPRISLNLPAPTARLTHEFRLPVDVRTRVRYRQCPGGFCLVVASRRRRRPWWPGAAVACWRHRHRAIGPASMVRRVVQWSKEP